MRMVYLLVPSVLVMIAVGVAAMPIGASARASFVLHLMPCMVAHLCIVRGWGSVPSPVMFVAGIAMDIVSDGPLGFWAWIYLFGVLISRQLPDTLMHTRLGRLSGLLLVVFALAGAQVALASLYQLRWIDWREVLAGTLVAGLITGCLDLLWVPWRPDRRINVMERGASGGGGHV